MVTKTGAIATTEIAMMGKPVVFLDINGGQERYNSRLMERFGMAKVTSDQSAVGRLVAEVLTSPEEAAAMLAAQVAFRAPLVLTGIEDWILAQRIR